MTEDQAPRTNREGRACPPWCVSDHGGEQISGRACVGHAGGIDFGDEGLDGIWACAILGDRPQDRPEDRPQVGITGHRYRRPGSPSVHLPHYGAEDLAAIVEMLAGATPDQHRELAAAIRKAAADITEVPGE